MVGDRVASALIERGGEFHHGFTYLGIPPPARSPVPRSTSCATSASWSGCGTTSVPTFSRPRVSSPITLVGEARMVGLIGALELVRDKGKRLLRRARHRRHPAPRPLHCERVRHARGARHDDRRAAPGDPACADRRVDREGSPVAGHDAGGVAPTQNAVRCGGPRSRTLQCDNLECESADARAHRPESLYGETSAMNKSLRVALTVVSAALVPRGLRQAARSTAGPAIRRRSRRREGPARLQLVRLHRGRHDQELRGQDRHQGHLRRLRFERRAGIAAARRQFRLRRGRPSASFLERQIKAGVFQKLDKSQIPNLKNMDPDIQQRVALHDPNNEHW